MVEPELLRLPSNNCYYRCVDDHFEIFVRVGGRKEDDPEPQSDWTLTRVEKGVESELLTIECKKQIQSEQTKRVSKYLYLVKSPCS